MARATYLVLARKYRPQTFEEVIGQDAVVQTLRNAIESQRVGQAYLFAGPRGVGKTTMARLLAKSLNCLGAAAPTVSPCNKCEACAAISTGDDIDVLEIDGASNRKVEESRDLRQTVQYAPARSRFKVYIIDEVHMLTTEAFNTLLKTLEEPPERVKFLFATTQPYKVPETILSRCQRLDFRRIPTKLIAKELARIAQSEKLKVEPAVLGGIARTAKGGMRDALSLLDLLLAQGKKKIAVEDMNALLGFIGDESRFALSASLAQGDLKGALAVFHRALEQGTDVGQFLDQTLDQFRALLLVKSCGKEAPGLDELEETAQRLEEQAKAYSLDGLLYAIQMLSDTAARIRTSTQATAIVELALVKLSRLSEVRPIGELLAHLEHLEQQLRSGGAGPRATPAPAAPSRSVQTARAPSPAAAPSSPAQRSTGTPMAAAPPDSIWDRLLQCLAQKKATLAASLSSGRILSLHSGALAIGLPRSAAFHKARAEEPENRALIESCAEQVTGKRWSVSIELTRSDVAPQSEAPPPVEQDDVAEATEELIEEPFEEPVCESPEAQAAASPEELERERIEARARTDRTRSDRIQAREKAVEEAQNDPRVRKTLELFRGTIIGTGD